MRHGLLTLALLTILSVSCEKENTIREGEVHIYRIVAGGFSVYLPKFSKCIKGLSVRCFSC